MRADSLKLQSQNDEERRGADGLMPVTGRIEEVFEIAGLGIVLFLEEWEGEFSMPATVRVAGHALVLGGFDYPRTLRRDPSSPPLALWVKDIGISEARGWIGADIVVDRAEGTR